MEKIINNEASMRIYKDRYEFNNEGVDGTLRRVANHVGLNKEEKDDFYDIMREKLFLPAGRTITNSGIGKNLTLNNCFNANGIPDDMGSIFDYVKLGSLTHQKGGGIGYDFSLIRPNGSPTSNEATASGCVSFMDVFDAQTKTILQSGRRGANMGVLNIYHPDIFEFLEAKSWDEGKLTQFNISIMVDNDFMHAKENKQKVMLHFPVYDQHGNIEKNPEKWEQSKEVDASELWDLIMKKAYDTGEYGVFFYENLNDDNNTHYMENIVSSNPCGEYVSGYLYGENINSDEYKGACNLGSLHLQNMVDNPFAPNAKLNEEKLIRAIKTGVRMLDNIIDINNYPHEHYENYQKNMRTIGLGFTGLANVFSMLGMTYGDDESIAFTDYVCNLIAVESYKQSIELSKEKGEFNFLDREAFVDSGFISKHVDTMGFEWDKIKEDILKYGIRNARLLSVAPVGTMSLTFGNNCSSGIEPTFLLETTRKVKLGGQKEENAQIITVRDYAYDIAVKNNADTSHMVTALELGVDDHISILKEVAFHTDMAVSKTINIPSDYSFEDTKEVYNEVWRNGIKGCTIFRPNSLRQGIIGVTDDTKENVESQEIEWGTVIESSDDLIGRKRKIQTGCGSLHIHAFFDPATGDMMEVFFNKGGQGGCFGYAGGLSRMISLSLRAGVPLDTVVDQLTSVQGCPSYVIRTKVFKDTGKGTNCSSAIGFILRDMHEDVMSELNDPEDYFEERKVHLELDVNNTILKQPDGFVNCPECGEKTYTNTDGCGGCVSCGYSKCG